MSHYRNIPPELRIRRQWVCSSLVNKMPLQTNGRAASSTDPATWTTFGDAANAAYKRSCGVGFVFTADDPYAVIDLDHVRNATSGETEPWALAILDELSSYSEVSISGTGWHIVVRSRLTGFGNKAGRVEIYDRSKVMTLTGNTQPFVGGEEIREVDLSGLQARIGTLDPEPRPVISGPSRMRATGKGESEEDYRLIGQIRRRLRTQDAAKIESEFQRKYPGRYNSQNQKHGAHCGRNYIRYSIERQLSGR